jgi:hypothetical protein
MNGRIVTTRRWSSLAVVGLVALATAGVEAQRWGRPRPPRAGACFYQNANFGGDWFCIQAGDGYDAMPDGLNDRISSIRVIGDASVVVYRNPNFGGRSSRFTDDVSNLQLEGWNDTISSVRVRLDLARVTRDQAEEIVRRAYQAVLGRDPDPGASGYIDRVMRDRWTQRDVERELRRSAEYRNRRPPQR